MDHLRALLTETRVRLFGKSCTVAALLLAALSLAPLLLLAPYAFPWGDDFAYGGAVYYTLRAGKGFWDVPGAVWENIRYTYLDWQGTPTSVVFFSLVPAAFADGAYWVTAYVMLAAIIAPVFLALRAVKGMDKWCRLFLGAVLSFYSVQYLPSLAQGVYWWNGGSHYLLCWCLTVWAGVWQIGLLRKDGTGWRFWASAAFSWFLGFCAGGGNYCTSLLFPCASVCLTGYALWERLPRPVVLSQGLTALAAAAGLLVSVLAPGNASRQVYYGTASPVKAVLRSFVEAGKTIGGMGGLKLLGALALCVPVFLYAVRHSGCRFRWPLLVAPLTFCLYATLYTPLLYSLPGAKPPLRTENLLWLGAVFLVFGNAFYLAGWAFRRFNLWEKKAVLYKAGGAVLLAGFLLFAGTVLVQYRSSNAFMAFCDLRSPVLQAYVEERTQRKAVYEDKAILPPRFQALNPEQPASLRPNLNWLTWGSDLLVDGVPVGLDTFRGRVGSLTYVELHAALEVFQKPGALSPSDFALCFHIRGGDYVPLRSICDRLGYKIEYLTALDTITIDTHPAQQ